MKLLKLTDLFGLNLKERDNVSDAGTMIIIGAGIAGVHAAETLRKEGHQGRIMLIDSEKQMPYDRPPLSKQWMTGEKDDADILLRDPDFYEKLDIDLKLGIKVVEIDPVHKTIKTDEESSYEWEKLMFATGSQLRTLSIEGDHLQGIFYLRNITNGAAIKEHMKNVKEVTIIGGGFIGVEMASSLTKLGINVTIVERSSYPMEGIVGKQISKYLLDLHQHHGVEVITDDSVVQFNGKTVIEEALTAKGRRIPCQAVLVSIGVTPNMDISHPQLQTDNGYIVDEYGETSISDIYAAGDCTSWPYNGASTHIEHWDHAVNHAKTTSQNMIQSKSAPYSYTPYFWSDQYDSRFQYFGFAKTWAKTVLRGSVASHAFTCFYLDDQNIPKAAFIANQPKHALPVRRMIKKQKAVNPEDLANEEVSLKKI